MFPLHNQPPLSPKDWFVCQSVVTIVMALLTCVFWLGFNVDGELDQAMVWMTLCSLVLNVVAYFHSRRSNNNAE